MKYFFIILSLLYANFALAFSDDICANVLGGNVQCTVDSPNFPSMYICVGTNYQSSINLSIANYGKIVAKALSGQPIDTLYVPTCIGIVSSTYQGNAIARWSYSSGATSSVNQNLAVTISSPAMSGGNIELTNASDPVYALQASPQYCSCNNYSAGSGPTYCNSSALTTFAAGSQVTYPYYGDGSSNAPPLNPCGGSTGGGPQGYNAGFFVLELTTASGQVPPAGTYNGTFEVNVVGGNPLGHH